MATMMKEKKQQGRSASVPRRMRERILRLLEENFSYMDSPTFRHKRVEEELFTEDAERELPLTSWYQPTRDDVADFGSGSPPQLMKGPEERLMFLRFNYCKKRLCALQKQIRAGGLTMSRAQEFLDWHRKFEHFREYLVRTNLALVLAMAKRTRLGDVDFAEVVSEGNMALLRAVDKFSVDRGFKFSTYACRAILKAFSRTAMKASKHRTRFPVEFEPEMEQSDWADRRRDRSRTIASMSSKPSSIATWPICPRRADGDSPPVQLAAGRGIPADVGRSRQDHRRDKGARAADSEQGAGQDSRCDGGRRSADSSSIRGRIQGYRRIPFDPGRRPDVADFGVELNVVRKRPLSQCCSGIGGFFFLRRIGQIAEQGFGHLLNSPAHGFADRVSHRKLDSALHLGIRLDSKSPHRLQRPHPDVKFLFASPPDISGSRWHDAQPRARNIARLMGVFGRGDSIQLTARPSW